jgi:hypothetical protein
LIIVFLMLLGAEFVGLGVREVRVGHDYLLRVVHLQLVGSKLSQENPEEEAKELEQRTLIAGKIVACSIPRFTT